MGICRNGLLTINWTIRRRLEIRGQFLHWQEVQTRLAVDFWTFSSWTDEGLGAAFDYSCPCADGCCFHYS
jgi:hypothetical protein